MKSLISIIGKIFKGIAAAVKWLNSDNEKLRRAKAEALQGTLFQQNGKAPLEPETDTAGENRPQEPVCSDPWDVVDNANTDMWMGRWLKNKMKPQHRDR